MTNEQREEMRGWIDAVLNGEATPDEVQRLESALRDDPAAQAFYVEYVDLHAELHWQLRSGLAEASCEAPTLPMQGAAPRKPATGGAGGPWRWTAAAAALLVAVGGLWLALRPGDSALAAPLARVTRVEGLLHLAGEGGIALSENDSLQAGQVSLDQGLAEITFADGAILLVEGPAQLEIVSASRCYLHAGRAVAHVPPPAVGFVLETAKASVLDLGTEFGVRVDPTGDTLVQVFEGVVVADAKDQPTKEGRRLEKGEALEITGEAAPQARKFARERFIRRFPIAKERGHDWYRPYNHARNEVARVRPAPAGIKIDGNLADWDLSAKFEGACDEPFAASYFVTGAMMYDAEYLYIGAHVGDPSPMESSFDPHVEPKHTWSGGSLQVRLCTDAALGWPLSAAHSMDRPKHKALPSDHNPGLVHLTLSYYPPRHQACLHLEYGMDYHGTLINPPGYQGEYLKDADGHGYTLEYAIPWKLLNASGPPAAGEIRPMTWDLHWSEQEGRSWRGHLVEIKNPAEEGWTFVRSATWGKAVFEGTAGETGEKEPHRRRDAEGEKNKQQRSDIE